jgi:penicillin-binding protein 1A
MKKKKKRVILALLSIVLIISIAGLLLLGVGYIYMKNKVDFSLDEKLFSAAKGSNITRFFYDSSYGNSTYTPKEYKSISPTGDKKIWYSYDEIGDNIKAAFLSAEDRKFFKHNGVDIKRTSFALINYFLHLKPKFGGSTITQQVIKNISGDNEQKPSRKILEIIRATHIEYSHSKEEIFEVYMNIVPMGEKIAGVGLASQHYFNKNPHELSIAEAATLVGITNAPRKYNPHINPDACKEKRNNVLFAMREVGFINDGEYREAINTPLTVEDQNEDEKTVHSWFIESVCDDIAADLMKQKGISESVARLLVLNGGLSLYTTVNPEIQEMLELYFENEANFPESVKNGLNYSMVITDSKNSNLLAIVGSVGKKSGNRILNYATIPHTPGSVLKPLALYAPLLNQKKINWATVFDDVPVSFSKSEKGYTMYPQNYPKVYDGLTTVSDALRLSKNTVAVNMYRMLDKEQIFNSLRYDFGFDSMIEKKKLDSGGTITDMAESPLALGQLSYGVSLRKLTEAYTVFPSEGNLSKGRSYIAVYDNGGNLILDNQPIGKRIFSVECARIMNQMLMRVVESGTAKAISLNEYVDTAGKTGTSGNDKNRLFIGYTPYYTAGIWCGYKGDEQAIGKQSISHLEIWNDVMEKIHESILLSDDGAESFSVSGLKFLPYCKDSGMLYTEECMHDVRGERLEYGYFTIDNKPFGICDRHVYCLYDALTGGIATEMCDAENLKIISLIRIEERFFPCEVYITDAQYVWRSVKEGIALGDSYDVPFFIFTLDDGEFVGRSKGKKQFNSSCYLHD